MVFFPATVTSSARAKFVVIGVVPVDQPNGDVLLAYVRLDLYAVAQQAVNLLVGVVECLATSERGRLTQLAYRLGNDLVVVSLALEPVGEPRLLDVTVVGAVLPVAEVGEAECILEERDHPPLREDFPLADRAHGSALPGFRLATTALPLSVSRYFCNRLLGLSGRVSVT